MSLLLNWLLLAGIQAMATISPGPAFAVVVRSMMVYDRRAGISLAFGLGLGVGVHIIFVLTGVAVILSQSLFFFNALKYAGAAYLIYIGFKALRTKKRELLEIKGNSEVQFQMKTQRSLPVFAAVRLGFLTNLLNPKAIVFFTAVFSQFIEPQTSFPVLFLFGMTSVIIEISWFILLTLFLTDMRVRHQFLAVSHWIERICGGFLMALGIRLALSKI